MLPQLRSLCSSMPADSSDKNPLRRIVLIYPNDILSQCIRWMLFRWTPSTSLISSYSSRLPHRQLTVDQRSFVEFFTQVITGPLQLILILSKLHLKRVALVVWANKLPIEGIVIPVVKRNSMFELQADIIFAARGGVKIKKFFLHRRSFSCWPFYMSA